MRHNYYNGMDLSHECLATYYMIELEALGWEFV